MPNMITVFRFEKKKTGDGPYRYMTWVNHTYEFGRPNPGNDKLQDVDKGIKVQGVFSLQREVIELGLFPSATACFGFETLKSAYDWFHRSEIKILLKNGFTMRRYRVPEDQTVFLEKQVMFNMDAAVAVI